MKKLCLSLLTALPIGFITAQTIQEISTGAGYSKQSYVSLSGNTETQVDNTAWDIAFTVAGQQDAGIFLNESAGSTQTAIELYDALTSDFSATPDPAALTASRLYNDEASWDYGAFNSPRILINPFDFGWGTYSTSTHQITGDRVFVIKLRSGDYLKFKVESLAGATYTFRYANLDGTNEQTKTILKTDFAGDGLAYFNFSSGNTVDIEPAAGFDLLFCRYITPLFDVANNIYIPYAVTGILSAPGVSVARADGVVPATVQYSDWQDSLSTALTTIGYDWKAFSNGVWTIDSDLVYFVLTADNHLFKIHFIDFEGSSTGTAVMEKTDLGILSTVTAPNANLTALGLQPNPAQGSTNLILNLNTAEEVNYTILDALGRVATSGMRQGQAGLNSLTLDVSNLQMGVYYCQVQVGQTTITRKLVITE